MQRIRGGQSGFSIVEALIIVVAVAVIAGAGWLVYQNRIKPATVASKSNQTTTNSQSTATGQSNDNQTTTSQTDPYAGWLTFTDNASAGTSGISIKYPSDWQVHVGGSKTYAWSISDSQDGITVSYIFQSNSETAQQAWQTCYTTDECGVAPGGKTLTGSESTINGLNAYSATMQSSNGSTYHVTVIRGDKSIPSAGTPYVEFITDPTDQAGLSIFDKIVASATFPN